jgi:hypothetical protein
MRHAAKVITAVPLFFLQVVNSAPRHELATLKGVVTDRLNGRIAHASVVFAKGEEEKVATTSSDGSYNINLDPGTYQVAARASGFCPGRRGAILLLKDSRAQIDFQLIDCGIIDSIESPPITPEPRAQMKFPGPLGNGYGEEELNPVPATGLRPLILFGGRQENDGTISYTGLKRLESRLRPVFKYNLATLKATKLLYHAEDYSVEGIGDITWQDGEQAWQGARIKVCLNETPPRVILND